MELASASPSTSRATDHHTLHPEAPMPEGGHVVLLHQRRAVNLPSDATLTEAGRYHHAVEPRQLAVGIMPG